MITKINAASRLRNLQASSWGTFSVSYDSPDGNFSVSLRARDFDHAERQLRFLRLNGRIDGQIVREIPKEDPKDVVAFDVPTLIRVLELSREGVSSDEQLHHVVEKLLSKSKSTGSPLTMDDYSEIFPETPEPSAEPTAIKE